MRGNFYIQKNNIKIEGICDEIAIKSFGNIFLLNNSEIYNFILKITEKLEYDSKEDDDIILRLLLSATSRFFSAANRSGSVSQEDIFSSVIKTTFERHNYNTDVFFKAIDKDELFKAYSNSNWKIFDTWAWSGRSNLFTM